MFVLEYIGELSKLLSSDLVIYPNIKIFLLFDSVFFFTFLHFIVADDRVIISVSIKHAYSEKSFSVNYKTDEKALLSFPEKNLKVNLFEATKGPKY